ncbi:non-ribosomal peptide synthetase [Oceaniglobus roseus]|uniref:non-ribosomal peptide synthetase n=1 Tax=Oceaniglobus roseus TaxID=1737570 RepID=UPI000C7F24D7|nr:non-ribosomal peptide synthetase [Kandeliimicrobium roseum]
MTISDILQDARQSGVRLSLKGGRLALDSRGPVPPALLDRIRSERDAIVAWLAQLAEDARAKGDPILPAPPSDAEPLSFSQSRLWIIDRMETAGAMYNVPISVRLTGPLDVAALERALDGIVARHAILRTVYVATDDGGEAGGVVQKVLPPVPLHLPLTDLSGAADAAGQLDAARIEEARTPFDLATGPVLRARLLKIAPTEHHLLLTLHHIATDGWSCGVLLGELVALYEGADLPPPALQFTDFARWQRRTLERQGPALGDWWAETLKGAPELHDLPLDRPRSPVRGVEGGRLAGTVPQATADRLRGMARDRGVTLFVLLYAAYAALVHRLSGQDDVVIGTPVAGRHRDELKQVVGFLVNTLPLRSRLSQEERFSDFLAACAEAVAQGMAHQDLPFEAIVERVNPRRSLSHAPIVQLTFLMTRPDEGTGGQTVRGVRFEPRESPLDTVKFELSLGVADIPGALPLDWNYATDLFEDDTVARFNRAFLAMLDAIAADPERRIADLPLLSAAEVETLLALGTGTPRDDGPAPPAPHRMVEARVAETPDRTAVMWQDRSWTYATLNARANRLARHLQALGVSPGDRVALATGRNRHLIEAMLATTKAGAAYVLVPVDIPAARIAAILDDSGARVTLTVDALEEVAALPGAIAIDDDAPWRSLPDTNLPATAHDVYSIAYTSGTTGLPKGIPNTALGLTNMVRWQVEDNRRGPDCIQTVLSNPGFDAIQWEFWPTLGAGGTVAILEQDEVLDPARMQAALDRIRPTHFYAPTGLLEALFASGLKPPTSLRYAFTAGDRLQGYCLPRDCGVPLVNLYGPTEASCITIGTTIAPDEEAPIPIGRPAPNTNAYILDPAGHLVPRGAVGELCLSGPFVSPGYLNRPEETARKFVPNPYPRPGHETIYRTGDLARWRSDGRIQCLGRNDAQVKIRGFRIEPQEVAAAILAQPGVRNAFVDVAEGPAAHLVAYVAAESGRSVPPLEEAVRAALARAMPAYMMPQRFVWIDDLPLTDRGKIDRRALAALAPGGPVQVNTASPRDDIEHRLYDIWTGVLLHPDIGLRDNFFAVGGTSLSAIKIMHRINAAFGTALPVTHIVAHPTIEALGGVLRSGGRGGKPQNPIVFRKGAGDVNVICIHPGGGTAFAYLSLARKLPDRFGVYGVQSVGVHEGETPLPDIGAMADHYIGLVRPLLDRPCVITGASFGGFVAYEMVRRLKLEGNDNATAVVLDAMGSDDPAITADDKVSDAAEFRAKLVTYNGMYPGIDDAQIERYHRLYNHNTLCSRRWTFRRTDGRVLLVQAIRGRDRDQLRYLRLFWQLRAKGAFLFKVVGGDHSTTLEDPDVGRVARIIAGVLDGRLMPREAR